MRSVSSATKLDILAYMNKESSASKKERDSPLIVMGHQKPSAEGDEECTGIGDGKDQYNQSGDTHGHQNVGKRSGVQGPSPKKS